MGNAREWNFYNPFKKFYGLSLKNSDEYPPREDFKIGLSQLLARIERGS